MIFTDSLQGALETGEIMDTFEYENMDAKKGFGESLYAHQKRSLNWMVDLENRGSPEILEIETSRVVYFEIINDFVDLDTMKKLEYWLDEWQRVVNVCSGGILADEPGLGKYQLIQGKP
jgi:SNF2 family DNA or RNA helicase